MKTIGARNIKTIMIKIKERTENQIKIIATDDWNAYENTIKKVFGYDKHNRKYNVIYNKVIVSEEENFFNYIKAKF